MYIEEHSPSPDLKQTLPGKLAEMIEAGKLTKVKHNYRIPRGSAISGRRSSKILPAEGKQREPSRVDKADIRHLNRPQIDADLARMEFMTAQEAADAAAQAVAEAELAMIEAEEAVRRAEAAEAEVEEAEAFAEAAALLLENIRSSKMV